MADVLLWNGDPFSVYTRAEKGRRFQAEHLGVALARTARASDVIGHLGRAEFAVIAPAVAVGSKLIDEAVADFATGAGDEDDGLRRAHRAAPHAPVRRSAPPTGARRGRA